MKTQFLIFLIIVYSRQFLVGVDFNTFSAAEMMGVIKNFGHVDFTWCVPVTSPDVSADLWRQAFAATNNRVVFSQDFPMGFQECGVVRQLAGSLTAAFGYHETGGTPATQLTAAQIDQYATVCNAGVVILTRAYWPNSQWKANTDKVLHHPKLYGVAMQFTPDTFGLRSEVDFIHSMLAAGKHAMFLLPFVFKAGDPTQKQITSFINYLKANGVNMADNRIKFVLARYSMPYIPVTGATNSIQSALKAAQRLKLQIQEEARENQAKSEHVRRGQNKNID